MVPRSDLLSATSELEELRLQHASRERKISALEAEIVQYRADLGRALAEAAEARSALTEMVPRSELAAAMAQCEALRMQAASTLAEHIHATGELQKRLAAMESERAELASTLQVDGYCIVTSTCVMRALNPRLLIPAF
jgi:chromosome segregation ATPase